MRRRRNSDDVLTGGRWVMVRGVQRWEWFLPATARDANDQERRVDWEDAMFTEDEAREQHARYANGCRDSRASIGERVYQRRMKRAQRARKAA